MRRIGCPLWRLRALGGLAGVVIDRVQQEGTRQLAERVKAQERAIDTAHSDIAVLKAERAHLGRPDRIEPIARSKNLARAWRRSNMAVISDPLMLRRILQNLLTNAVQYTKSGGIKLAARRRGGTPRRQRGGAQRRAGETMAVRSGWGGEA